MKILVLLICLWKSIENYILIIKNFNYFIGEFNDKNIILLLILPYLLCIIIKNVTEIFNDLDINFEGLFF